MEFAALLMAIGSQPWAIDPLASRPMISSIILAGRRAPEQAALDAKKLTSKQDASIRGRGSVAAIRVHGPMFNRVSELYEHYFGLTSTERVTREVRCRPASRCGA